MDAQRTARVTLPSAVVLLECTEMAFSARLARGVTTMPRWHLDVQRTAPVTLPSVLAKLITSETVETAHCVRDARKMPR